jgi:alkylation response protein AidB-like acyl-CoA dehydrogenase
MSSESGSAEFAGVLHEMLDGADVPAVARRWAEGDLAPGLALWRRLAGLGVTGLAVPEKQGGLGASPLDLVAACEELGHHAVPGPVAETLAAVPVLLAGLGGGNGSGSSAGSGVGRGEEWLGGLAAGELIATLAMPPWLPLAADTEAAGLVLLAADGVVRVGRAGRPRRSVDSTRSVADVAGGAVLGTVSGLALEFGTVACAAQLLGAGRALLEASVRHVRVRTQFGRPVGAFQAVKHKLADVAIGLEFARPLLHAAALALGDAARGNGALGSGALGSGALGGGAGAAGRDVSAAKVACADAAYRAARAALQVHGAIGYTEEHDVSLWLTKIRALIPTWGTQAEHRARVLETISWLRVPNPS